VAAVPLRSFISSFAPGGIIVLATVVLLQQGLLADSLEALVHIYPGAVAVAGLFLGWRFKRSRLIFALLLLAIADRALVLCTASGAVTASVGRIVYDSVSLLLPLNLVAFSLFRERGLLTLRGASRLCFLLLQVFAVDMLCWYRVPGLERWLDYTMIEIPALSRLPLSQPAIIVFAGSFLLLAFRSLRRLGAMESGFLWALVSCFFALAMAKPTEDGTIFFATAGLVLVLSLIESSHTMAFLDELTELPGRRALNEALLRLGSRYTVAMVDVDFFKKFNDRYGHDVGDQVLKMVAARLSEVSGGGKAFRYGGEEFAVIFPGKSSDQSVPYLESLRKTVERSSFRVRGRKRPRKKPVAPQAGNSSRDRASVTVSIGAAERDERHPSPEEVVQAADKALYRAKQTGRNRVVSL
jgi:diguanylate cyclase (GGDEF)-like protein